MTSLRGEEKTPRRSGPVPGPPAAHALRARAPPPRPLHPRAGPCARARTCAPGGGPPPQGPGDLQAATAGRQPGLAGTPDPRAARAFNRLRPAGPVRSPLRSPLTTVSSAALSPS